MSRKYVVQPFTCVIANVPGFTNQHNKYVCRDLTKLSNALIALGYRFESIIPVYCANYGGFTSIALVKFGSDEASAIQAYKLQDKFEEAAHSREEWYSSPGEGPYLWVATKADLQYFREAPFFTRVSYAVKRAGRQLSYNEPLREYNPIAEALASLPRSIGPE